MNTRRPTSGFTLIELLVVISIIAVLAGLAMGGIGAAMKSARKTQASALISQIKTSVVAYSTEYGHFPIPENLNGADYTLSSSDEWKEMVIALSGNRDPITGDMIAAPSIPNSREIGFFEFSKKDLDNNGALKDPTYTGASPGYFVMILDGDYDSFLTVPADPLCKNLATDTPVNSSAAIYSRVGAREIDKPENALTSW